MFGREFIPGKIHVIIGQLQGILDVDLVGSVKYRRGNIEAQRLCRKAQMNLQHLPDIHTGGHAQRVQHDIQRTSVRQERHILHRKHAGNNTLVTMASRHFITHRDLSKNLGIHNNSIFTMGHLQ